MRRADRPSWAAAFFFLAIVESTPGLFASTIVYVTQSASNKVTAVDVDGGRIVATIPVGAEPFGLTFSPDGRRCYVALAKAASFAVLDTRTNSVVKTVPLDSLLPVWMAVSSDESFLYVTNEGSHDLTVVALAEGVPLARIPVGRGPAGLALSPRDDLAYVAGEGTHDITVVDLKKRAVIATIPVGSVPQGVALTRDGAWICVANFGSSTVSIIEAASRRVAAEIPVDPKFPDAGPTSISILPDERHICTGNFKSGSVSVLSLAERRVIATIPTGAETFGVAVDRSQGRIYAVSGKEGRLSILAPDPWRVVGAVDLEPGSYKPAVMPIAGPQTRNADWILAVLGAGSALLAVLLVRETRALTAKRRALLLAGILGVAFILRWTGIDWGIPVFDAETARAAPELRVSYHLDEEKFLWNLVRIRPESLDFYVADFHWGTLQFYLIEGALLFCEAIGYVAAPWREAFLNFDPHQYERLFVAGRAVSVILGSCSAFLIFRIGKRLYGERAGLVAALILALLPIHVVQSHYLTPDVTMAFFLLLAFAGLVREPQDRGRRWATAGGVALGLAISAKYTAIFFLPVAASWQISRGARRWHATAWMCVGTLIGFVIGEPYVLTRSGEVWNAVHRIIEATVSLPPGAAPPWLELVGMQFSNFALFALGLPVCVALMAGAAIRIFGRQTAGGSGRGPEPLRESPTSRARTAVIWTILVFSAGAIGFRHPMLRYLLVPAILACLPAGAVVSRMKAGFAGALFAAMFAWSAHPVALFYGEHTANQSSQWIERHAPEGASIQKGWPGVPVLNPEKYAVRNFFTGGRMVDFKDFFRDANGVPFYPDYVLLDDLSTFTIPEEFTRELRGRYVLAAGFRGRGLPWLSSLLAPLAPHDWKYSHPEIRIYMRKQ